MAITLNVEEMGRKIGDWMRRISEGELGGEV